MDLEDLLEDINVYCELEQDTHLDFWKVSTAQKKACLCCWKVQDHLLTMQDMTIVCMDELQKLKRLEEGGKGELKGWKAILWVWTIPLPQLSTVEVGLIDCRVPALQGQLLV